MPFDALPDDHPGVQLQADYLAVLCLNVTASIAPDKIILGGGVLKKQGLLEKIHAAFAQKTASYWGSNRPVDQWIVASGLDGLAGLAGAFELASDAYLSDQQGCR